MEAVAGIHSERDVGEAIEKSDEEMKKAKEMKHNSRWKIGRLVLVALVVVLDCDCLILGHVWGSTPCRSGS